MNIFLRASLIASSIIFCNATAFGQSHMDVSSRTQLMLNLSSSPPSANGAKPEQLTHGSLSSLLAPLRSDTKTLAFLQQAPSANVKLFLGKFYLMFPGHKLTVSRDMERFFTDPRGPLGQPDSDNPDIPSFFTFIGQFLDHDLTKNVLDLLNPIQAGDVTNNRSPLFDLDSVYGALPYFDSDMYEAVTGMKAGRFLLGGAGKTAGLDVIRDSTGTAMIPDTRNDENQIISQIHVLFQRFHNNLIDQATQGKAADLRTFRMVRSEVLFNYQRAVIDDYLPRTIGQPLVDDILKNGRKFYDCKPNFNFDDDNIRISHEFGGATFRLGHSQIRAAYQLNAANNFKIFTANIGEEDLRGSRPLAENKLIDWSFFLPVKDSSKHSFSMLINTRISTPLFTLPVAALPDTKSITSLPERNVVRGNSLGLASGEYIAGRMGEKVLTKAELDLPDAFANGAPFWYYMLKEAELRTGGKTLGPVGGRIVGETMLGILMCDENSVLNNPSWHSQLPLKVPGKVTYSDIVTFITN